MTGFKTGDYATDGREVEFIPTAPNSTTGFVTELESGNVVKLDESAEDALIRVIGRGFAQAPQEAVQPDEQPSDLPPSTRD